jgi:glycosyltransferase involved in cell wall biosynthesis
MLIIDAYNIKTGGGLILLKYFITELQKENIKFIVLVNIGLKETLNCSVKYFDGGYMSTRKYFLKDLVIDTKATCLICFGNFPPPFKMNNLNVITYVQNSLYSMKYNFNWFSLKDNVLIYFKHLYFKNYLKNTDYICFQTDHTLHSYESKFKISNKELKVFPFFMYDNQINIQEVIDHKDLERGTFIYVSSSDPHKNHINLLKAWEYLLLDNLTPTLYLTLPENSEFTSKFHRIIKDLNVRGCKIINLGYLEKNVLMEFLRKSEFCIYPSYIETIGLGLIEAALSNKKVLCSNVECLKEVIQPSLTFNPFDAQDIASAVRIALDNELPPTKLLLKNKISDFISFIKGKLD